MLLTQPRAEANLLINNLFYFNPFRVTPLDAKYSNFLLERSVNNFGDLLSPVIVMGVLRKLGFDVTQKVSAKRRLLALGSIMHFSAPGDVVWGSGINGKIPISRVESRNLDVRLLRGPLTRDALGRLGINCPQRYGDPGLLLSYLYPELMEIKQNESCKSSYVLVPNYNDLRQYSNNECLVDPTGSTGLILERVLTAKFVIASSLHALVVADSFGIKCRPLLSGSEPVFKYLDYYAGTGRTGIEIATSIPHALELGPVPKAIFDPQMMIDAFPRDIFV